MWMWGLLMGVALLAGCGAASTSPPPTEPPAPPPATWHKDIAPLVRQKCGGCHVEGGIAPFALQTYQQAFATRQAIRGAVKARIMPPWPPSAECAEYTDNRSLTTEQIDLIARWVDEGGAEGNPADAPASTGPAPEGLSRVDLTLTMPEAYTPQKHPDDYRCFILDWPEQEVRYITGFRGNPDHKASVHHIIAFLAPPGQVAEYQKLDAAEEGPGYTCFGGPGVSSGDIGSTMRAQWVGSWVPGSFGTEFPAGSGLRIEPGSKLVLQIHYNVSSSTPAPDRSSLSLKVDSAVDKLAYVLPWANPLWVTNREPTLRMHIPAGQAGVTHGFDEEPTRYLSLITNGLFANDKPIQVHGAALHMHTRGTRATAEIWRAGNSANKDCLLNIPRWDFHWQGQYRLSQSKTVRPGDRLAVECRWDNTGAGAKDIYWGEGTADEMCLGTFLITQ
jgi:hypothetical protein